jgi:hypothetical protein
MQMSLRELFNKIEEVPNFNAIARVTENNEIQHCQGIFTKMIAQDVAS